MSPEPEVRIGDAEREAAVSALGEHYAAGRLTKEEYDERAEQAFAARTSSQLFPLFVDLPRPQGRPAGGSPLGGPSGWSATSPPGRDQRPPAHRGWWVGARLIPVLAVVVALAVLAHLPWFLLLLIGWVVFAKTTGRWSHRHHHQGWGPRNRTWR